ncbi:hypothetical protein D1007_00253 [Hordeum vulgare]|nr:hypothetical protein D1007_00253 [Hordeum vulgare]
MSHGVAFDPVASPPLYVPDVVSVTPPRAAHCFNAAIVSCIMSIFFCGTSEKLAASKHELLMFSVLVASPTLVRAMVAAGVPYSASVKLVLHASIDDARLAARALPPTAPLVLTWDHPEPAAGQLPPPELLLPRDPPSSSSSSPRLSSYGTVVSSGAPFFGNDSYMPSFVKVFMLEGDYEAAMHLAFVSIEPSSAFINADVAVQIVLAHEVGHLSVDVVPSSARVMYLRFTSFTEHEVAVQRQPFPHDGARNDLHREEDFGRVPRRARFCVWLTATSFPTEFLNPRGIRAAISSFGKVLEVDPRVITGRELAMMRVVVLIERPHDIWPWVRGVSIKPLKFWDMAESFGEDDAYIAFFADGPPPFAHNQCPALPSHPSSAPLWAALSLRNDAMVSLVLSWPPSSTF